MKQKKILKGAEAFGGKVTVDPSIDTMSRKAHPSKKLEEANRILSKMKNPPFHSEGK